MRTPFNSLSRFGQAQSSRSQCSPLVLPSPPPPRTSAHTRPGFDSTFGMPAPHFQQISHEVVSQRFQSPAPVMNNQRMHFPAHTMTLHSPPRRISGDDTSPIMRSAQENVVIVDQDGVQTLVEAAVTENNNTLTAKKKRKSKKVRFILTCQF